MRTLIWITLLLVVLPLAGQSDTGELRLQVLDPSGGGVAATVEIQSAANQYHATLATTPAGVLDLERLPFGAYQLVVERAGFAPSRSPVQIRTVLPTMLTVRLALGEATTSVSVSAAATLLNPDEASTPSRIGAAAIQDRLSSLPGRSLQDLINTQPGWLYEGNAVLHPRGSEYQTQFVIDGVPIQDNRSPGFGPELATDDIAALAVYTAAIPAEYGRKLGGVVEVNTLDDSQVGWHGQAALSGGSYATLGGFLQGEYTRGKNTVSGSVESQTTAHYLNPVVPQNYANTGSDGDFALDFERRFSGRDRLRLSLRHELADYDIPNEQVQQAAGQLQTGGNYETMAIASYQHILSAHAVAQVHAMVRGNATRFDSNPESTPMILTQRNHFDEAYVRADLTEDRGRQEWQLGLESDNTFLHEDLAYRITDPSAFDPGTPGGFAFTGPRPDLEQGAYAQDEARFGAWTLAAGARWDHYQLLLNRQALSPRLALSRACAGRGLLLHASYDRVFQTPSSENILLSNSVQVQALDPSAFLRLPVQPSWGNYYQAGFTQALLGQMRLEVNLYRRDESNYADDDQIQNTGISFPISFARASIAGAEAQLALPHWGRVAGTLSYSYMVGTAWLPVTGGLFLGDEVDQATLSGKFPVSQDQRNTVRGRLRYRLAPWLWLAGGAQYDSGLPFEFDGDPATALAEYGPAVLGRVNFERGRIRPSLLLDLSVGAEVWSFEHASMRLQVDGENLTNVLDVIDFGGLFSGNAIGPGRSAAARLELQF